MYTVTHYIHNTCKNITISSEIAGSDTLSRKKFCYFLEFPLSSLLVCPPHLGQPLANTPLVMEDLLVALRAFLTTYTQQSLLIRV